MHRHGVAPCTARCGASEMHPTKLGRATRPPGVEDDPRAVEDTPRAVEDNLCGVEDNLCGVEDNPRGVEDNPSGVEDTPRGVEDNLRAVEDNLRVVEDNGRVLCPRRRGNDQEPNAGWHSYVPITVRAARLIGPTARTAWVHACACRHGSGREAVAECSPAFPSSHFPLATSRRPSYSASRYRPRPADKSNGNRGADRQDDDGAARPLDPSFTLGMHGTRIVPLIPTQRGLRLD